MSSMFDEIMVIVSTKDVSAWTYKVEVNYIAQFIAKTFFWLAAIDASCNFTNLIYLTQ